MLDRERTALLVIDFQERLLPKIAGGEDALAQTLRLARFAGELDIPIIWTEQYPKGLGKTVGQIAEALAGVTPIEKTAFGCFGAEAFVAELEHTGRRQLLVTGIETHVCVLQTVLAGLRANFEVYVVRNAVGSRHAVDHEAGLDRMVRAGAVLVTAEMALFEMLRDAASPEFKQVLPLLKD